MAVAELELVTLVCPLALGECCSQPVGVDAETAGGYSFQVS